MAGTTGAGGFSTLVLGVCGLGLDCVGGWGRLAGTGLAVVSEGLGVGLGLLGGAGLVGLGGLVDGGGDGFVVGCITGGLSLTPGFLRGMGGEGLGLVGEGGTGLTCVTTPGLVGGARVGFTAGLVGGAGVGLA